MICSKATKGILESVVNPNTMEVIHYWPSDRERVRRLVKVESTGHHDMRSIPDWFGHKQHTVRYTELSPTRFKDF